MIFQQFNLVRRLQVMDNVLVGRLPHVRGWRRWATLARWFPAADRAAARRALAHVGLLARAWQRTDTLSGGEQQRVAIAKILAQAPAIILGDEPVASLDVANGAMVMDTLRRVASEAGRHRDHHAPSRGLRAPLRRPRARVPAGRPRLRRRPRRARRGRARPHLRRRRRRSPRPPAELPLPAAELAAAI